MARNRGRAAYAPLRRLMDGQLNWRLDEICWTIEEAMALACDPGEAVTVNEAGVVVGIQCIRIATGKAIGGDLPNG